MIQTKTFNEGLGYNLSGRLNLQRITSGCNEQLLDQLACLRCTVQLAIRSESGLRIRAVSVVQTILDTILGDELTTPGSIHTPSPSDFPPRWRYAHAFARDCDSALRECHNPSQGCHGQ